MMTATKMHPLRLSSFGLKDEGNTQKDINEACLKLRTTIGKARFDKAINNIYFNLMQISPGSRLHFVKFYKGDRLGIFIILACLFISENPNYCFAPDIRSIYRDKITAKEIMEQIEAKKKKLQEEKDTK